MNYVDYNFKWLCDEINKSSEDEIFNHIKNKYLGLSPEIKDSLEKFLNNFNYWGKLDYKSDNFEEIKNRSYYLKKQLDLFIWLYDKLEDYRSKKLLFGILYNWYDYNFDVLKELMDNTYCHYFDLDIIKCEDEVFVDVGAYNGDTTTNFINSYGTSSYKKIYCYEITDNIFDILSKNLSKYPNIECRKKAISNKKQTLKMDLNNTHDSANKLSKNGKIKIKATSLDNDISEQITMIKMDIEGEEINALKGARNHIEIDKPKLMISVYHNYEDLVRIPKLIDELNPNYHFYLRFYGTNIFPTEIVLFAVNEKNV